MNCFVIMPFAADFDDVYAVIKSSVEAVGAPEQGRCFRLDESRPAGRITDRLVAELRSATFCVADVTGSKPNVMWELGFAMALSKPTIVVTQDLDSVPFDIKDMQTIGYDRTRLNVTLGQALRRSVSDTMLHLRERPVESKPTQSPGPEDFAELVAEMGNIKAMVKEVVDAWKPSEHGQAHASIAPLAGAWVNTESDTHCYARIIRGEFMGAYCFGGNESVTGVYFGWRRVGEYWFARFRWMDDSHTGFTFLRPQGPHELHGAWWSSDEESAAGDVPPKRAGVQSTWIRDPKAKTPVWAEQFFSRVEKEGLAAVFAHSKI